MELGWGKGDSSGPVPFRKIQPAVHGLRKRNPLSSVFGSSIMQIRLLVGTPGIAGLCRSDKKKVEGVRGVGGESKG